MKIGGLQIIGFKNYKLGTKYEPVNKFYTRIRRRSISINLCNYCILITFYKMRKIKTGKSISVQEFAALMRKKGVDLSKAEFVEGSVSTPIIR